MTEAELAVQGLFVAIGYEPNTDLFAGQLTIGEGGYLEIVDGETDVGIPGVFVAGDVHDHHYRQAVTAAGDGCGAAIDAERWLASVGEIETSTPRTGRPRPKRRIVHYTRDPIPRWRPIADGRPRAAPRGSLRPPCPDRAGALARWSVRRARQVHWHLARTGTGPPCG